MRRLLAPLLITVCLAMLLAACYGRVLVGGEQFGYRDAVQYYYPLYARVQAEWHAGRVPFWEPGENAGMPLLGNPSAAVLYPGKLLYAVLPYAWAARLYVVVHTLLACATMGVLVRSWGAGATGTAIAALAYGFGAPILFQYCNVIYLVGAAWAPLGFHAADCWLRLGRRWGLIELAVVLALIVLGGDPESAYLLVVAAGGYAVALSCPPGDEHGARRRGLQGWFVGALILLALLAGWVLGVLALARWLPAFRGERPAGLPPPALPWMRWVPAAFGVAWVVAGVAVFFRWRSSGRQTLLASGLLGLAGAACLAVALGGAQILPALEFTGQTERASVEDPHDIYPFSLEPVRVLELAWPNAFGTRLGTNCSWLEATRPASRQGTRLWVPSLYLGGLTLVLVVAALRFRGDGPARGWLSAIAIVSLAASLGEFGGPLWWARYHPAVAAAVGPHDPADTLPIRADGQFRDGDGSFYWLLATALPGFGRFRFPSKLLSFTALAAAGLAGLGWDRLAAGAGLRRAATSASVLLAASLIALAAVTWDHRAIVAALRARDATIPVTVFGPLDVEGAYDALRRSLAQGSIVFAAALVLVRMVRHGRGGVLASALAPVALAADLAMANAPLVLTVPQALLDARPEVVGIIEQAERRARAGQPAEPFRVHRMPMWYPAVWNHVMSPARIVEFDRWERDTIRPKYGLLHGIEYTLSWGMAEIDDYMDCFSGFRLSADAATARLLGVAPGQPVIVSRRRAFDLWNTRYFIVPADPNGWNDESRAYAAFVADADRIFPPPGAFQGPDGPERRRRWVESSDFQVFRNRNTYPRSWVVHDARFFPRRSSSDRALRDAALRAMLDSGSSDPRRTAWLEADSRPALAGTLPGTPPLPSESPQITRHNPQRIEIDLALERPGLVVLADTYDPGWRLTVDGVATPVHRANLMMRAALVAAGRHHLVFRYEPHTWRLGVALSVLGLVALGSLGVVFWFRPGR
jgi:hypothetical protein